MADEDRYLTGSGEVDPEQRSASYNTNTSFGPFSGGAILSGQDDMTPTVGGRFTTQLPEGLSATLTRTGQAGSPMERARDAVRLAKQLEAGQLAFEAARVGEHGLPSYGLQLSGQLGKQGGAKPYYPPATGGWYVDAGGTPGTPERHIMFGAKGRFAHGGEIDAALHAVRQHFDEGGFLDSLRSLFSGDDYQSTGDKVIKDGEVQWGNPESAADFFRADKARMALDKRPAVGRPEDDVTGSIPQPLRRPAPEAAPRQPIAAPAPAPTPEPAPVSIPYTAPSTLMQMPGGHLTAPPHLTEKPGFGQSLTNSGLERADTTPEIPYRELQDYKLPTPQAAVTRAISLAQNVVAPQDETPTFEQALANVEKLHNAGIYSGADLDKAGEMLAAHLRARDAGVPVGEALRLIRAEGPPMVNQGMPQTPETAGTKRDIVPLSYAATPAPAPAVDAIDQATGKLTARIPEEPFAVPLTRKQGDLIARTVATESSGDPAESRAIADVILNRIRSGRFGDSPEAVLFAKRQFEPWMNPAGPNYPLKVSPTSQKYLNAQEALEGALTGGDTTGGAYNFWGPGSQFALGRNTPRFAREMPDYIDIGATRFHRPNREEGGEVNDALRVVREHHADGEAVGPTAQQRLRETIASIDPERSREQPVMDPATMGEAWDRARRNYQNFPVQEGGAVARPLELGARDVIGGAIAGGAREPGAQFRRGVADLLVGSTGLPDSGTLGFGLADAPMLTGVPLTLADMAHDVSRGDYVNAAANAVLPAAFYARGPLGAAGKRAVEIAKEYAKPAAATAAGVAGATVAPDEAEAAVPFLRAMRLTTARNLPKDEKFLTAVRNTPHAVIQDEHLVLPVTRNQKYEQSGEPSVRGGVFYLPEGSSNQRYYTGTGHKFAYGGPESYQGETAVANPLFVKGATGGKAPEEAYKYLMGKEAFKEMQKDVMRSLGGYYLPRDIKQELVQEFLEKHAPSLSGMEEYVLTNSSKGNQLRYALQEAAAAEAARQAGHDAILGYSTSRTKGPFLSEIFDVRERSYPRHEQAPDIWPMFLPKEKANGGSVEDHALMLVSKQA